LKYPPVNSGEPDPRNIKKGTFYFYPPNSQSKFVIVRGDSIQEEIKLILRKLTLLFGKLVGEMIAFLILNLFGKVILYQMTKSIFTTHTLPLLKY
jgi:hypothetical protein